MIIFGYRQTVKELATLITQCRKCGTQGWHRVYRLISWFTLFFIPVLPVWIKRSALCGTCGQKWTLTTAEAETLIAHSGQRA